MNKIQSMFVKRNVFNLTHDRKFDMQFGRMVPILCEEVLPGDSFKIFTDMLVRFAPMVSPMYHEVNVKTRYFFVPNRLIWSDWEKFITGGSQGTDAPTVPTMSATIAKYDLGDYFGLPVATPGAITFSALPYRAYSKIWNDWFMDQTLNTADTISLASGNDITTSRALHSVAWEKDYFTSALPFTQRGNPVTIPLGTSAPVTIPNSTNVQLEVGSYKADGTWVPGTTDVNDFMVDVAAETGRQTYVKGTSLAAQELTGTADLSSATASTVNDLRLAFQIQKFMEKLARTGARYIEYILAMFGVRSSDARLQRSEYLGGGSSQVIVSEVLQTSSTDGTSPQGNMAGHGFSRHMSHEFKKSFEEHGYIIGLMYVVPRTAYQQGLPRAWSRTTKFDYYVPLLAHLGEQAVLKKELYADPTDGHDDEVFGYQGRFDEYRRRESTVCGDFRNVTGLGTWHMGRVFAARPVLNAAFITADTVPTRPFADTTDPQIWVYLKNNVKAIRPLPKTGEPGMIDH